MTTQISAAIIPAVRAITQQFPPLFLHPDLERPFLSRGESGRANSNFLETIFMTRSSSHLTVPCLVTVPDLNVTLQSVRSQRRCPLASLFVYFWLDCWVIVSVCCSQHSLPLDRREITWDNKQGWSIPRRFIDSSPLLITFSCVATLGDKEFQSAVYLIHVTGKAGRN